MNTDLLRRVADAIERGAGFDILVFYEYLCDEPGGCRTVACVAGHAAMLMGWNPGRSDALGSLTWSTCHRGREETLWEDAGQDALDLNDDEADLLFALGPFWRRKVGAPEAVVVLRALADAPWTLNGSTSDEILQDRAAELEETRRRMESRE